MDTETADTSTRERQPRMSIGVAVGQSQVVSEETSEEAQAGEQDSGGDVLSRARRAETFALAEARKAGLRGGQGRGFESLDAVDGETSQAVPEAVVAKGRRYSSAAVDSGRRYSSAEIADNSLL